MAAFLGGASENCSAYNGGVMRRPLAVILLVAALPGCANYAVYGSTGGAVVIDGGLHASITLGATAANVLAGVGIVSILLAGNGLSPIPPPPMREDREINEQDCTAPIASTTANLKCR
jgi:hypothetical protein